MVKLTANRGSIGDSCDQQKCIDCDNYCAPHFNSVYLIERQPYPPVVYRDLSPGWIYIGEERHLPLREPVTILRIEIRGLFVQGSGLPLQARQSVKHLDGLYFFFIPNFFIFFKLLEYIFVFFMNKRRL